MEIKTIQTTQKAEEQIKRNSTTDDINEATSCNITE